MYPFEINIDLNSNTSLTNLSCRDNQLTSLDLNQNISLIALSCSNNQLVGLDVSQNIGLMSLYCENNQIMDLDLSPNVNLIGLFCRNNPPLSSLDVKNGSNTNLALFDARNSPNLTCIQVDDSTYSATNWTNIDAASSFNTSCSVFSSMMAMNPLAKLTAFPNPTTKDITLDFGKAYQTINLQVRNLTGQIVLNRNLENVSNTTLELEGAAGVYFVRIQTEVGTAVLRVIKA